MNKSSKFLDDDEIKRVMSSKAVTHQMKDCADLQIVMNTLVEEREIIRDLKNVFEEEVKRGEQGFKVQGDAIRNLSKGQETHERRINSLDQRLKLQEEMGPILKIAIDTQSERSKQQMEMQIQNANTTDNIHKMMVNLGARFDQLAQSKPIQEQKNTAKSKWWTTLPLPAWIVGGVVVVAIVAMLTDHSDDFSKWISLFKDTQVTK